MTRRTSQNGFQDISCKTLFTKVHGCHYMLDVINVEIKCVRGFVISEYTGGHKDKRTRR